MPGTADKPPAPDPTRSDWIDFLYYMADQRDARGIVSIVEKPWAWAEEYAAYLAEGGLDR